MDAVEDYARRWIKREVDQDPELESLSDWVRTIRSLVQGRIHKPKNCVNSRPKSVFKDQEAVKCLSSLHDKYVIKILFWYIALKLERYNVMTITRSTIKVSYILAVIGSI